MTEQIPRAIVFEEIRKGDTIEQTWYTSGKQVTITRTGVVHSQLAPDFWAAEAGGPVAVKRDQDTYRLLARPKPKLPTEPGSVIRIGDVIWLLDDVGDWYESLTNSQPHPEDATEWTVIHPKDNSLRDKLEALAATWEKGYGDSSYPQQARALLEEL